MITFEQIRKFYYELGKTIADVKCGSKATALVRFKRLSNKQVDNIVDAIILLSKGKWHTLNDDFKQRFKQFEAWLSLYLKSDDDFIKEELEAVLKEKVGDDLDSDLQHAEHWYEHWKNIHNNTSDKNGQMWDDSRMQMQHYLAQITNIKAAKKAAAAKKKAAAKEAMKARRQDALSTMDTPQEAMEYWCGKDCPPDTPVPEDWKERTKAAAKTRTTR